MAIEPATNDTAHDYVAHTRDYSKFTKLLKYGAIISFVTAIVVLFLIS